MFLFSFNEAIKNYTKDDKLINKLWNDIVNNYSSPSRFYHNLKHPDHLTRELMDVSNKIDDWDLVVFAVAYHDIVYNILKNDNEEKSAEYAYTVLDGLLNETRLHKLKQMILATKTHELNNDSDTNYFIDADLSILGSSNNGYRIYTQQIRREYKYYPEFLYKPGRRKVLQYFLKMNRIFKTDYFFEKYEQQARINLQLEFEQLSS